MQNFFAAAQNILNGSIGSAWTILWGKGGRAQVNPPIGVFTWDAEEDNYDIPALPHTAHFQWNSETDEVLSD